MKTLFVLMFFLFIELNGETQQLTNGDIGAGHLEWSPDGKMIASCDWGDNESIIWITNVDGSGSRKVDMTPKVSGDFYLSWSPDSKELLFDIIDVNGAPKVCRISIEGGSFTKLTEKGCIAPSWSADGTKFAYFSNNEEIYIRNIDGTGTKKLTNNSAFDYHPDWHPDGTKVLYTSNINGNTQIYTVPVTGETPTRISNNNFNDDRGCWSPDGTQIAFVSDRGGENHVWIMNSDGSNAYQLTTELSESTMPTWSPDGSQIAVSSTVNNQSGIYIIDVLVTDIDENIVTETFSLEQNYPNPFNPSTIITYQLPKNSVVDLSLYSMIGEKLVTLVSKEQLAGNYKVEWDALSYASGIYFTN